MSLNSPQENFIHIKDFILGTRARNTLSNDQDIELLRSELFSIEQLKRHAVTLAKQYKIDPAPGADKLLPRLADNERVLLAAYDVVFAANTPGQRIVPAEAWLLDNFYLIEQQINQVRRHCHRVTVANCHAWRQVHRQAFRVSMIWLWS